MEAVGESVGSVGLGSEEGQEWNFEGQGLGRSDVLVEEEGILVSWNWASRSSAEYKFLRGLLIIDGGARLMG